jgi:hypothetical protein
MRQIINLINEFSPPERPEIGRPNDEKIVAAFEQTLSEKLPKDFIAFLCDYDSIVAMDIWNGYWIGGLTSIKQMMEQKSFPSRCTEASKSYHLIPIATDGGGNGFLMALGQNNLVWKWWHETEQMDLVAKSFSDFLERVKTDWEHFLRKDYAWQYLSG